MKQRSSTTYQQTKNDFLQLIRERKFSGNKLPTEKALTQMLSCSRGTLREIMREFEHSGFITKKQGIGNFIHPSAINRAAGFAESLNFKDIIKAAGKTPRVELIKKELRSSAPKYGRFATMQELFSDMKYTVNVFYADDKPAIYSETFVPRSIILDDSQEKQMPLFDFLKQCCNQTLEQLSIHFFIVRAEEEVAEVLQVPVGKPLLLWEEQYHNYSDEIICMGHNYFNLDVLPMSLLRRHED